MGTENKAIFIVQIKSPDNCGALIMKIYLNFKEGY